MISSMKKLLIAGVALIVVLFVTSSWYHWSLSPLQSDDQTGVIVDIPSGSSVAKIGSILEEKQVIRSALAFRLFARFGGMQGAMKAGSYFLRPSMPVSEIMTALGRGYSEAAMITIPEGYTIAQIDALMAKKGLSETGSILACAQSCDFSWYRFLPKTGGIPERGGKLEGYLFPDTYFIVKDTFTPESFLKRLLDTFQKRVVDGLAGDLSNSKRSLQDIVTMASLLEEETRAGDERPVVSGILWKRFDKGMRLDVDAAVRYLTGKFKEPLKASDLALVSPYNLRKEKGLPPGAIANPGMATIKAALGSVDSDYWYYLHDTNGRIHYAVTNDEQNENRAKYLR